MGHTPHQIIEIVIRKIKLGGVKMLRLNVNQVHLKILVAKAVDALIVKHIIGPNTRQKCCKVITA